MKKLDEAEKKTLIIWIIFGIIFAILALLININIKVDVNKDKKEDKISYNSLKDHSRYYVVKGALSKFYSFLNSNNTKSILNIIDDKYIEENDITENNVKDKLGIKETNLDLDTYVMYEKNLKNGLFSYLVRGTEIKMTSTKQIRDVYYEVILDGNKYLFSVKPLTKEKYEELING